MPSYVISVSAGKGCYRHICISADATLFDFHAEILDAFDFIDDHAHAFFMDNRIWSDLDSYYAEQIEDELRHTSDYTLGSLNLIAGKAFKYVFDFGEEWEFSCKVLRVHDDPCIKPAVVRRCGESPIQYEWADDSEDSDPYYYSPEKLEALYRELSLPDKTISLLHTYFAAMARLYGVISLKKVLEIINVQNDPISENDFIAFSEIVRREKHYYSIFGEDELYDNGKITSPLDREIIEQSLYSLDLGEYEEMKKVQNGKPYYIPSKEELLKYADEDYYEMTRQRSAMQAYLRRRVSKAQVEDFDLELQLYATLGTASMQRIMDDMTRMGLVFNGFKDVQNFISLLTDMSNHSRMALNRGHTPVEIGAIMKTKNIFPRSISFGTNMTAALKNGAMDLDELRQGILRMELPNENLRQSMLGEISRVGASSSTAAVVKKEKTGRNDPCPCGSGKKYKKCCGRDQ